MESNMLSGKEFQARRKRALNFLANKGKDHLGRTVEDYMNFTEQEMHNTHDWVQWAFPIDTISVHNPEAGLIDYCSRSFANYDSVRAANRSALTNRYLASIGVRPIFTVLAVSDVNKFFATVPRPDDHHMKRISRLLRHHMLTGSDYVAKHILSEPTKRFILSYPEQFSTYTVAYWNAIVYDSYLITEIRT